jgi:hypothetical protein
VLCGLSPTALYLRRGYIVLIVGAAVAVISFSMLGYYAMQFLSNIQQEGKYAIQPGHSINLRRSINDTQGIYIIAFADFIGAQASVTIKDSLGKTVVDNTIDPPIIIESFNAQIPGPYNLMLLNPTDQSLEAAIYFGGQEQVLNEKNYFSYAITLTLFMSLLGIGIALAIAGMVIIILDKRRTDKMKQFGDTSDLI